MTHRVERGWFPHWALAGPLQTSGRELRGHGVRVGVTPPHGIWRRAPSGGGPGDGALAVVGEEVHHHRLPGAAVGPVVRRNQGPQPNGEEGGLGSTVLGLIADNLK